MQCKDFSKARYTLNVIEKLSTQHSHVTHFNRNCKLNNHIQHTTHSWCAIKDLSEILYTIHRMV